MTARADRRYPDNTSEPLVDQFLGEVWVNERG
jgi:hypothetical protein